MSARGPEGPTKQEVPVPARRAPRSTHTLGIGRDTVTKRYISWERDEHGREWRALTLITEHAPDLAPAPLTAHLDADPPTITMSRLPGSPLAPQATATPEQLKALAEAITTLHEAIPPHHLTGMPPRIWHPTTALEQVRSTCAARRTGRQSPAPDLDPVVTDALTAAEAWLSGHDIDHAAAAPAQAVLGQADGNLANFLWDPADAKIRLVDFEDSGLSDATFEIAEIIEHLTSWADGALTAEALLAYLPLSRHDTARLLQFRRLLALWWLLMLLPDGPYHARNPSGTLERQATRLLRLLG